MTRTLEARNPPTVSIEDKKPVNFEAAEWIGIGTVRPVTHYCRDWYPLPGENARYQLLLATQTASFYFRFSASIVELERHNAGLVSSKDKKRRRF